MRPDICIADELIRRAIFAAESARTASVNLAVLDEAIFFPAFYSLLRNTGQRRDPGR
jgi:hypothetical protein